jgi:hypothetical protein
VFTMVSDLGKLKRKVDLLGSPKDTVSHRCVCPSREQQQAICASVVWYSSTAAVGA